jgi:hypothetical protein
VNGRGWASKVIDPIHLDIERKSYVVSHHFETGVIQEVENIVFAAGEIIIDAKNIMALLQEFFAKMRSQKARTASH